MNINMIDPQVLTALRKAEFSDERISTMTANEVFEAFCRWEGLLGRWHEILWRVVRQLQDQQTLEHRATAASEHRLVGQAEFHQHLRKCGSLYNCGCTTSYDDLSDETRWIVAGNIVGVSLGRVGETKGYLLPLEA